MALPFDGVFMMILDRHFRAMEDDKKEVGSIGETFFDPYGKYSPEDSELWSKLWADVNLSKEEGAFELAYAIVLARGGGCVLKKSKKYGYMIKLDENNKDACWWWKREDAYNQVQNVFREHNDLMLELLKGLDR